VGSTVFTFILLHFGSVLILFVRVSDDSLDISMNFAKFVIHSLEIERISQFRPSTPITVLQSFGSHAVILHACLYLSLKLVECQISLNIHME